MNARNISANTRSAIKRKISETLDVPIASFELIASGCKDGRPNWEIEPINGKGRIAFTAFGPDDIHDFHIIRS